MKKTILLNLALVLATAALGLTEITFGSEGVRPIADAGLPRYAATDPVQLDGSGSYDPDNSGPLSYTWKQIAGPSLEVTGANNATPTVSGFTQTDEIQECEFELVVSDGELTSLPDTVKVIIVPAYRLNMLPELTSVSFDPNKPTVIVFRGGGGPVAAEDDAFRQLGWVNVANVIEFREGYILDRGSAPATYYRCGDMVIVYLSSVAPNYNQLIQTIGASAGGMPAIDVGIHLNVSYADRRYAVNRVTLLDCAGERAAGGSAAGYASSIDQFLAGAVDGEQCWVDNYESMPWLEWFSLNNLSVYCPTLAHVEFRRWYQFSLANPDMNQFNHGVVAGAYWSVVGPGKNLQLAPTPGPTYTFQWDGSPTSGHMDFFDESSYPGRLPQPVTLVGPVDVGDPNGSVLTCEESENAVGYQLLFGPEPYRVMDYNIISDTPTPPTEVITTLPFEETWWTVRAYDQYGSTIYADPMYINESILSFQIKNLTSGKRYSHIKDAIHDANPGDEIVVGEGIYRENIDFKGKNLMLRSTNPKDPAVVAAIVINGGGHNSVVTFSSGEDANCVFAGFTVTGGKTGIYCSGSSPTITNCTIANNTNASMGGGIYIDNGSSPMLTNCTIINNSASYFGGGIYNQDSSPTLTNCTFSGNWASYFGGGIYCSSGSPTVTNSIFWADTTDEICVHGGTPVITHSDVKGGWPGEGNIDTDPLFADPNNGDYHLKSQSGRWDPNSESWIKDDVTSPCIDAGDPNSPWQKEQWPHGKRINMGAYGGTAQASMSLSDAGSRADCNNDGSVDARDLMILCKDWLSEGQPTAADINRDSVVNFHDFALLAANWLQDISEGGLVAHWKLDETDGDIAYDSAGNNDATAHNGLWDEGRINGALQFNGFNTYMDCGDSEALGPEQMTFTMWLRPEHMGGMRYIASRANKSDDKTDYALMRHLTGQMEFTVGQLSSDPVSILSIAQTPLNEWYHVAVCLNGSEASIYMNGQWDTSASYAQRVPREGHRLVISSYQGSTRFFNGRIDDVRIYNQALSAEEIETLAR